MSWQTVNFKDAPVQIIDGDRGKNYPKQNEFSDEGHCLFLSATNVTKSGFSFATNQFVTQEKHDALRKGTVERGDVILTTRGTLGNVALYSDLIPYPVVRINSGMVTVKPDRTALTSEYLYHFLRSDLFQAQVRALQSGVAQPQLPIRDIKKIKFKYPDLPTQERIAGVLSAYDDLIENNQRRISFLEEAARLIYREWFVHFRFPGHGTAKFENGLPVGWKETNLAEVVAILSGGTPRTKTESYWNGSIPFFTPKDTGPFAYALDTEKMITEEGLKNCNSKLYPKDTLFITARGTVGKLRLAQTKMAMNQSCYALVSKSSLSQKFLYFAVSERVNYLKGRAAGAVFDAIVVDTFKNIPFVLPDGEVLARFEKLAEDHLSQIDCLVSSTRKLTQARDLLLPRLMDGRIAV